MGAAQAKYCRRCFTCEVMEFFPLHGGFNSWRFQLNKEDAMTQAKRLDEIVAEEKVK